MARRHAVTTQIRQQVRLEAPPPLPMPPPGVEDHTPLQVTIPNLSAVEQPRHTGMIIARPQPDPVYAEPVYAAPPPAPAAAPDIAAYAQPEPATDPPRGKRFAQGPIDALMEVPRSVGRIFGGDDEPDTADVAIQPTAQIARADPAIDSPAVITSPQIVINRKVVHVDTPQTEIALAQGLGTLSPAAGGEEEPAVNMPLIPIPPAEQSAPADAPSPAAVPPPPAVAAVPPAAVTPTITPLLDSTTLPVPGAAAPPPTPPPAPPPEPAPTTANSAAPPAPGAAEPTPTPSPSFKGVALEDIVERLPEADPAIAASKPPETLPPIDKTPAPEQKPVENVLKPPSTPAPEISTEPPQKLSKSSKDVLGKLPGGVDSKKDAGTGSLNVEHTKTVEVPVEKGQPAVHEAVGVKLEVNNNKASWDYELNKAYNALISGNTSAAVTIYKTVLANDPNNKNALFGLATTYHRAGQLDMARPLYARLLSLEPDNRDALNNFMVLIADEAPEEALAELQRLEDKSPDFSPIPAQMAVIYQRLGKTDQASEKMFRAIALSPENITYRYNLAIMLDKQRKYDEAAKLYKQIVQAYQRGEMVPGNIQKIEERLTFISSNRL